MKCNQCDSVTINGVFCHERGCPNNGKEWRDGEWVSTYECPECGNKYLDRQDAAECCAPVEPQFREAPVWRKLPRSERAEIDGITYDVWRTGSGARFTVMDATGEYLAGGRCHDLETAKLAALEYPNK